MSHGVLMSREDPMIRFRAPPELKAWLEDQAKKNGRSMNAELVWIMNGHKNRLDILEESYRPMSTQEAIIWMENSPDEREYAPLEYSEEEHRKVLSQLSEELSNEDLLSILRARLKGA